MDDGIDIVTHTGYIRDTHVTVSKVNAGVKVMQGYCMLYAKLTV